MSGSFSVHTNPSVSVQISSSGGPNKFIPIEKNISRHETIRAVKGRLEVITSADRNTMTVKVFNRNDELVCVLDNDDRLLGSYHIDDGMRLHVEDEFRLKQSLDNDANVEKFVMPEEEYSKRTEKSSSVNGGFPMACPARRKSDLIHKDTKQPRRPRGCFLETNFSEDSNLVTSQPDTKEEETTRTSEPVGNKNFFVRKTSAEISKKALVYSPAPVDIATASFSELSMAFSKANRLESALNPALNAIAMNSKLSVDAEEFTPSKRIPIIDPRTNQEIALDDIAVYQPTNHRTFFIDENVVHNLFQNSAYRDSSEDGININTTDNEIGRTIDYIVRQLLVNPGSLDDLMKVLKDDIKRWGFRDVTIAFIMTCIIDATISLDNFAYLGAKICCHLDKIVSKLRPNISIRTLVLTACEDKFSEFENWLLAEETRNTAYNFIFFLAELYDQLLVQNARIKALWEALCGTYIILMKDPNNSFSIRCLCKVLKLTGRNLYQDNRLMLQGIIAQLEEISRSNMFDSQTAAMLSSVIGLANSHWGLDESQLTTNHIDSAHRSEGRGAEMYGPDGRVLTTDEKKFLADHCLEVAEDEEEYGLQDSYVDSDDGMDEEMQEAFEQFLLSVPEAR
ncbi:polyadenylate-binding protein-interacting protein 1 isoform X2 [Nilaparvata lugens]|uniref:polyadenylate-binding protein-interacting protein 1 isoform X2 n=1 Tax=Nilaparvata lugens TaxID=108931 RepID=UPI00193E6A70|nr:polyadenylate-binding protein-interacting protein 1 isoform X2 [Nilaparvata lugens]